MDPSWWFTGLFFYAVTFFIKKTMQYVPFWVRTYFRKQTARRLLKIKRMRNNYLAVNYEIGKTNSYFILFILVCCLFLFWLISGPLNQVAKSSKLALLILSSPLYVIEILWLLQDAFTKDLIERSHRLRMMQRVR